MLLLNVTTNIKIPLYIYAQYKYIYAHIASVSVPNKPFLLGVVVPEAVGNLRGRAVLFLLPILLAKTQHQLV